MLVASAECGLTGGLPAEPAPPAETLRAEAFIDRLASPPPPPTSECPSPDPLPAVESPSSRADAPPGPEPGDSGEITASSCSPQTVLDLLPDRPSTDFDGETPDGETDTDRPDDSTPTDTTSPSESPAELEPEPSAPGPTASEPPGQPTSDEAPAVPAPTPGSPPLQTEPISVLVGRSFTVTAVDGTGLGTARIAEVRPIPGCATALRLEVNTSGHTGEGRWSSLDAADFRRVDDTGADLPAGGAVGDCGAPGTLLPTNLSPESGYTGWVLVGPAAPGSQLMLRPEGTAGWMFTVPAQETSAAPSVPAPAPVPDRSAPAPSSVPSPPPAAPSDERTDAEVADPVPDDDTE